MEDRPRRRQHLAYVVSLVVSQALWCYLAVAPLTLRDTLLLMIVPMAIELGGPIYAENRGHRTMTPWHPHHIAERYGLLVIIALGEGVLGTTTALASLVSPEGPGWSWDVAVLGFAGVAMTFGIWWIYFGIQFGDFLHKHRDRGFGFGYGHYVVLSALVAVGAGLHVAAYFFEGHSKLGTLGTVVTIAIPLAAFILSIYVVFAVLTRTLDTYHVGAILMTAAVIAAALVLAARGASLPTSLLVLTAAPWVTVLAYERHGHRHQVELLAGR